jgi:hypothetical protein
VSPDMAGNNVVSGASYTSDSNARGGRKWPGDLSRGLLQMSIRKARWAPLRGCELDSGMLLRDYARISRDPRAQVASDASRAVALIQVATLPDRTLTARALLVSTCVFEYA